MPAVKLVDVALVIAVTASSVLLFLLSEGGGGGRPAPLGVGLLVAAGGALLLRRVRPVSGLVACLLAVLAYLALDFPGGAELPSVLCAVYAVASSGRRWPAVALTAAYAGVGVVHRIGREGEDPLTVLVASSPLLLLVLLGDAVHARAALRAETRERMRLATVEKEAEARARVALERLRLAHELHDIMAHTITTMTVQAGAAMDLLEHDPGRARQPLEGMRAAAKDAMVELRALLEVLRLPDGEVDRAPVKGLAQLPELVESIRSAGVRVEVLSEGSADPLPPALDRTCFRVVQEACTNVLRHAGASRVVIRLRYTPSAVEVDVEDDGIGAASTAPGGVGLVGLGERVTAIGGRLDAGPAPDGSGFRVAASLPRPVRTGEP